MVQCTLSSKTQNSEARLGVMPPPSSTLPNGWAIVYLKEDKGLLTTNKIFGPLAVEESIVYY